MCVWCNVFVARMLDPGRSGEVMRAIICNDTYCDHCGTLQAVSQSVITAAPLSTAHRRASVALLYDCFGGDKASRSTMAATRGHSVCTTSTFCAPHVCGDVCAHTQRQKAMQEGCTIVLWCQVVAPSRALALCQSA